jgi:hypothetical protein
MFPDFMNLYDIAREHQKELLRDVERERMAAEWRRANRQARREWKRRAAGLAPSRECLEGLEPCLS